MIVEPIVWYDICGALIRYTNKTGSMIDVLTSKEVLDILHNIDEHLDKIQLYYPNEDKVLRHISKNIGKTVKFMANPPMWFRRYLFNYLLYKIGAYKEMPIMAKDELVEFVKVFPVEALIEERGNRVYYYLVYPNDEEIEKMVELSSYEFDKLMLSILRRYLTIDYKKRSIGISNYANIILPSSQFLSALTALGMRNDNVVNNIISNITTELLKYGTVSVSNDLPKAINISVELMNIGKEIEEKVRKYNIEIEKLRMFININGETWSITTSIDGDLKSKDTNDIFDISLSSDDIFKIYKSKCKTEMCSTPNLPLKLDNMDDFYENLPTYMKIIGETLDFIVKGIVSYHETGTKYGYSLQSISKLKKTDKYATINIIFSLYDTENKTNHPYSEYTIEIHGEPYVIKYLRMKLPTVLNSNEKITEVKRYYVKINGYVNFDDGLQFSPVFERIESLVSIINSFANEVIKSQSTTERPIEAYVALLLASELGGVSINTITNESETSIYNLIADHFGIKRDNDMKIYNSLLIPLFKQKHITIDEHLNIYINGKSFVELLVSNFPTISKQEAVNIQENIIKNIIQNCYYDIVPKDTLLVQKLADIGILNESILVKAMKMITLEPDNFTINVDGKPLWDTLSENAKNYYILNTTPSVLMDVFKDPALMKIFSDKLDMIETRILKSEDPDVISQYLAITEKYSNIIGNNVEILVSSYSGLEDGTNALLTKRKIFSTFFRPKNETNILVQVAKIGVDRHRFVIIDTSRGYGFLIEARNLDEGIRIFKAHFDYIDKSLTKAEKLCDKYNIEEIKIKKDLTSKYMYKYIEIKRENGIEVLPANINVLRLVNEYIRKKQHEYEVRFA